MNKKIKWIIAGEGIILSGFFAIFILGVFIGNSIIFFVALLGYTAYLFIRFIVWALRILKANSKFDDNPKPKSLYESRFLSLMNGGKFKDALGYVFELEDKNILNEDEAKEWGRLSVEGYATSLYEAGMKYAENMQYDEAVKSLHDLRALIIEKSILFGLEEKSLPILLAVWDKEIKKNPITPINEFPALREKLVKPAQEIYKDALTMSNVRMLFDALFMPAVYKSMMEEKK